MLLPLSHIIFHFMNYISVNISSFHISTVSYLNLFICISHCHLATELLTYTRACCGWVTCLKRARTAQSSGSAAAAAAAETRIRWAHLSAVVRWCHMAKPPDDASTTSGYVSLPYKVAILVSPRGWCSSSHANISAHIWYRYDSAITWNIQVQSACKTHNI